MTRHKCEICYHIWNWMPLNSRNKNVAMVCNVRTESIHNNIHFVWYCLKSSFESHVHIYEVYECWIIVKNFFFLFFFLSCKMFILWTLFPSSYIVCFNSAMHCNSFVAYSVWGHLFLLFHKIQNVVVVKFHNDYTKRYSNVKEKKNVKVCLIKIIKFRDRKK